MSAIKDLDKAFEEYSRSKGLSAGLGLNKKVSKRYEDLDSIASMNSDDISTKLYKIIKFGGNMTYDGIYGITDEGLENDFGTTDPDVIFYDWAIPEYLKMSGIQLPINFKSIDLSDYTLISAFEDSTNYSVVTNTSQKFLESLKQEYRRDNGKDIDHSTAKDYCEKFNSEWFYLIGEANMDFNRLVGRLRLDISKSGDFFVKMKRKAKDKSEDLQNLARSLCLYFQKNAPEYFDKLSQKIDEVFDYLSKSSNPDCARAMRESVSEKRDRKMIVEVSR